MTKNTASPLHATPIGRARGFTLTEVAMAVFVAGLALAGTLKGTEFVSQSRIKGLVADYTGTVAAYHMYTDRYAALPGDDPRVAQRWTSAISGNGDRQLSGRFDASAPSSLAGFTVDASGGESLAFWWHMRLAGLIPGASSGPAALTQPVHAYAGILGVQQGAYGLAGVTVCLGGLADYMVGAIDAQLDDSRPGSGSVRTAAAGSDTPTDLYRETRDDTQRFVLCGAATGGGATAPVVAMAPH
jgi:prepilin-type N-terminal cleavage/methylation domain-containing protein